MENWDLKIYSDLLGSMTWAFSLGVSPKEDVNGQYFVSFQTKTQTPGAGN